MPFYFFSLLIIAVRDSVKKKKKEHSRISDLTQGGHSTSGINVL